MAFDRDDRMQRPRVSVAPEESSLLRLIDNLVKLSVRLTYARAIAMFCPGGNGRKAHCDELLNWALHSIVLLAASLFSHYEESCQ